MTQILIDPMCAGNFWFGFSMGIIAGLLIFVLTSRLQNPRQSTRTEHPCPHKTKQESVDTILDEDPYHYATYGVDSRVPGHPEPETR